MIARRLILAIETSNPSAGASATEPIERAQDDGPATRLLGPGVALGEEIAGDGVRVLDAEPVDAGTRRSDDLMAAIDRVCARHRACPADLETIAVSVGPGAYTALRVAVTTAKILAFASGAGVIGVPTWAAVARATAVRDWPAAMCLASKGASTSVVVVPGAGACDPGATPMMIDGDTLEGLGARTLIGDAHLPAGVRERAGVLGIAVVTPVIAAETLIAMIGAANPDDPTCRRVEPDELAPIYAREPDAVTQWRARNG